VSTLASHDSLEWPVTLFEGFDLQWAVTEGPISAALTAWDGLPFDLSIADRGVIFGPLDEVRFRRLACGTWRFALITDRNSQLLPPWTNAIPIEPVANGQSGQVILWGEWDAGSSAWIEGRIPVVLPYPIPGQPAGRWRIAIQTTKYRRQSACPPIERYVRLSCIDSEGGDA